MSIKTATVIAAVGVALGLVMTLAAPFAPDLLVPVNSTRDQFARIVNAYHGIRGVLSEGGLLLFLLVLASKQKEKA